MPENGCGRYEGKCLYNFSVFAFIEIIDVDLQRDREKDFRSFSLGGFSFDAHSPAMAGK